MSSQDNAKELLVTHTILCIDKEAQLVTKTSKHSSRRICLPRNCFIEAFNVAHDHRLSGHPRCERFFYWPRMYKWIRTLTKSCLIFRKNKQIIKNQNTALNEKWWEKFSYLFDTVALITKDLKPDEWRKTSLFSCDWRIFAIHTGLHSQVDWRN